MKPIVFMKNVLFCTLPLSVMLLSACGPASAETPFSPKLDDAYSVQAEMTYQNDNEAKLLLTRYDNENWDAAFAEPSALAGVILSFEGDAVSASYKGLSFTIPKTALPAKSMLVLLIDVLDVIGEEESIPCVKNDDGTWTVSGETEGGNYTLTFQQDGTLSSFSIPNQPLDIQFSDYHANSTPESTVSGTSEGNETTTTETTTTTAATE
ncbi:MAG: hypothetical protein IKM30_06125 [Oscillospiraceae bacterium]|nr:hypothetical protein [Oscillospiraceae bacterium]